MKLKIFLLFTLLAGFYFTTSAQVDTVINRYRRYLWQEVHPEDIDSILLSLKPAGYWPDIDYTDENRAAWQQMEHLRRIEEMAVAWSNPSSDYFHKDDLKKGIDKALDYWLYHRIYNPNWWYNEIGVPQYMRNILVLLEPYLSSYQRTRAFEELAQYRINGTGSNLIWSAELGFFYGALTNDRPLMKHCIDTIGHEIRINTGEGIQPDYSFHMHGNRLQIYSYGKAYLSQVLSLISLCKGTDWALPEDKVKLLVDFVLKGWQWMARGINTVPGTVDRSVSHPGALHAADIRKLLPELIHVAPEQAAGLRNMLERQNGAGDPLTGFRYYPYSDFAAYQCKKIGFFLKTVSTRTLASESINGENLKGYLLNSGDAYLIHDGTEYFNLMPVWKWNKIPGITGFDGAEKIIRKSFVGSVSDGIRGLTAMDYAMEGKDTLQKIRAHKIWVCNNNMIICLVAGLTAENIQGNIYTVLDQCRLKGSITMNVNGNICKAGKEDSTFNRVRWLQHGNFAYFLLKPEPVRIFSNTIKGSWSSINYGEKNRMIKDSVFMSVLIHRNNPGSASTGYVLAYCPSAQQAAKIDTDRDWKILRNDTVCQAVRYADGTLMAAFFRAGGLVVTDNQNISVNRPCLVISHGGKLYISDPLHRGGKIIITDNDKKMEPEVPDDGTTIAIDL